MNDDVQFGAATRSGPLAAYRERVEDGHLAPDPAQAEAAGRLDRLWRDLVARHAAAGSEAQSRIGFRRRFGRRAATPAAASRGIYLVGAVGRGKSMLMDLFFETAPDPRKRRVHFHRFMQDVHGRLHAMRRTDPTIADPIPPLADAIAAEASLLCFDEFQVNDIADALILGRLFELLFRRGVAVVATSNTRPERLFQDRPGADAFRPFIAVLLRELDVLELQAARDYRRERRIEGAVWHAPINRRTDDLMDKAFLTLAAGEPTRAETLAVSGRTVTVKRAAGTVARFGFDELCAVPLGAGDYLAIARRFEAVLIDHIPRLGTDSFDLARRFITLIDALYEARVKLVASADDVPDRLYERGEGSLAFERTASRLAEMGSGAYRVLPHLLDGPA